MLAHPATRGRDGVIQPDYLERLIDEGLFGLEIDHRENSDDGKEYLRALTQKFSLVITGSSDYHGVGKPNLLGENLTFSEALQQIVSEATGSSPVYEFGE